MMLTTVGKGRPMGNNLTRAVPFRRARFYRPLPRDSATAAISVYRDLLEVIPVPVTLPTSPELHSSSAGPTMD